MDPLVLAKARSLRRRHQRGAALFVVAMALAVLASVGIFALAAAATEVRTSGNERQNAQTHYLSQYGILVASTTNAPTALLYLGAMQGMLGGIAGCAIAEAGIWLLNRPLREFTGLYGSDFQLRLLPAADALAIIALAGALGWLGALLSVSKHLWQIEPR